jgi:hypothetical protein
MTESEWIIIIYELTWYIMIENERFIEYNIIIKNKVINGLYQTVG